MQRRGLLYSLGALATGSIGAVGTGAFTSTTASRSVNVNVTMDSDAYLKLRQHPSSSERGFSNDVGAHGELMLEFNGDGNSPGSGVGLNPDSTYTFDDVFQIENAGTQTVYAYTSGFSSPTFDSGGAPSASNAVDVSLYYEDHDTTPLDGTASEVQLDVGDVADIGVKVVVPDGAPTKVQRLSATLTAENTSASPTTTYTTQ